MQCFWAQAGEVILCFRIIFQHHLDAEEVKILEAKTTMLRKPMKYFSLEVQKIQPWIGVWKERGAHHGGCYPSPLRTVQALLNGKSQCRQDSWSGGFAGCETLGLVSASVKWGRWCLPPCTSCLAVLLPFLQSLHLCVVAPSFLVDMHINSPSAQRYSDSSC